ncbi:MAG: V-type ATP synthase subunit F [Candidatus Hydrogenedentes bacterium]|jgi:vacuolar-type H+-ATPase subunit F/Vma7|nr:V-type ATP synthase subunit F [Candidatus Hydrogenedentota bacterium]|tara:strand:+ start:41 stop:361 length:321 start_codon:yes stop_codon:yes gene_type:complete
MSKIAAIAKDSTALNLALTGVRVEEITDIHEVESRFEALMQDELDVLIVDDRYREDFSERFQERLRRHSGEPLIVFCPHFDEEDSDVDAYLSSVIKPAVGFEIRLG